MADVAVSNMSVLPADASSPQLPGQTQATTAADGSIDFNGIILLAAPGLYRLFIALPSFPQVTGLPRLDGLDRNALIAMLNFETAS